MGLNASQSKNKGSGPVVEPIEPGSYPARLVVVADLGLQPQRAYQGKDKEPAYEILTTYELLDEFMKDEEGEDILDKPRWVSENFVLYGIDVERANSTKRYISLDPNMVHGGDWASLIGMPCMITLVNNPGKGKNAGKVFTNIAAVAAMRAKEAAKAAPLVNEPVVFDLDAANVDAFHNLLEWIQKRIAASLKFNESKLAQKLANGMKGKKTEEPQEEDEGSDDLDDEIPF